MKRPAITFMFMSAFSGTFSELSTRAWLRSVRTWIWYKVEQTVLYPTKFKGWKRVFNILVEAKWMKSKVSTYCSGKNACSVCNVFLIR